MAKMDCGARKMNLLEKYHVQEHLTNLKGRIDPHDFHQDSLKIEDILGSHDVDVKPILAFRAEIDRRDKEKAQRRVTRAQKLVTQKSDWLLNQFVKGKSIPILAEELDISGPTLRHYVKRDPDLSKVYRMMRYRREYDSRSTASKIQEMLEAGCTQKVIAMALHVTRKQVEYQQYKRRKA